MSREPSPCASSPRGGLCKAFKDMKTKVATHTGMSLTFVELVATSPAVVLLPVLPPSPRSPSALLHRRMHHHSYTFSHALSSSATTRRSSTEATSSSDEEMTMATTTGDAASPACCKCSPPSSSCGMLNENICKCCNCSPPSSSCDMLNENPSPRASSTCHVNSIHPSALGQCGRPLSSSGCNEACRHSRLSSPLHALWSKRHFKSAPGNSVSVNFTKDDPPVEHSSAQNSYSLIASHASMFPADKRKHARNTIDGTARFVLCYLTALAVVFIGIIRSTCVLFLKAGDMTMDSLCALHPRTFERNIIAVKAFNKQTSELNSQIDGHETEISRQQGSQISKMSSKQRTKLLKNKLRSSFKSLSVQVPNKAFAPLHLNTSLSSLSSSTSSSPSPSSSVSSAYSCFFTAKKTGTPTPRLTKSFNARPCHCSTVTGICFSPALYQQNSKRSTTTRDSMIASLVSFPLALCGLFFGKFIAGGVVTFWLLVLSVASNMRKRRALSQPCQI
ncbi:hypothetical protein L7F22_058593 [Adiantum nelumboides]|nr:hypothetical protein [Adiantum nelumboides]